MVSIRSTTGSNSDDLNKGSSGQFVSGNNSSLGQSLSAVDAQLSSIRSQPASLIIQSANELDSVQQSRNAASTFTNQNFDLKAEAEILFGKAKELEFRAEGKPLSEALALKQEAKKMREEAKEKLQEAEQANMNADAATVEADNYSSTQNNTQNELEETTSAVSVNSTLVEKFEQTTRELLKTLGLS